MQVKRIYCPNKYITEISERDCKIMKRDAMIWGVGTFLVSLLGEFVYE